MKQNNNSNITSVPHYNNIRAVMTNSKIHLRLILTVKYIYVKVNELYRIFTFL